MFEFELIQELKPNDEILEIIKDYNYTVKNGKIKHLKSTKLKIIKKLINNLNNLLYILKI